MNSDETIQYLIEIGKITKEDVQEAKRLALSEPKKSALVHLHLQFCDLDHDIEEECDWYGEEQFEDCWERPCHQHWVKLFNTFLASANTVKFVPKGIAEESTGSPDDSALSD